MLKHIRFQKDLVELMETLEPEEPLPPVRQLIKDYQVSLSTVRRVLDDLEHAGKIIRKRGTGVFPRPQKSDKQRIVGLYLPRIGTIFYEHVLMGVVRYLREKSVPMLLFQGKGNDPVIWREMLMASNMVIMPSADDAENVDFIRRAQHLQTQGVNIVVLDNPLPGVKAAFVGMDNYGSFRKLAKTLRRHGCRNIALIGKSNSISCSKRIQGFRSLEHPDMTVSEININRSRNQPLTTIAREIFRKKCDAVVIADANVSVELSACLTALCKREAHDIMITGVTESGRRLDGKKTITVEKPGPELGRCGIEQLLRNEDAENREEHIEYLPLATVQFGIE